MTENKAINDIDESNDFAAMFEKSYTAHDNFQAGDKVEGKVVGITRDSVFVDIGAKSEAVILSEEFRKDDGTLSIKSGDKISAYVTASGAAGIELSLTFGRGTVSSAMLSVAKEQEIPVEGMVSAKINGGFTVMIDGVRAFCPVSQIDRKYSGTDSDYLNKKFRFAIIELKGRDCVVSRRILLDREQQASQELLKNKLAVGDILTGKVTRTAEFGVFVDIGGIEGLVPRSELSRSRSVTTDRFSIGSSVSVKILALDWEAKRYSLSIKETEPDPWDSLSISESETMKGTITNIIKGGAFVEVAPGLEGFIHVSKMSYTKRIAKPEDVVSRGDHVSVKVISIDKKDRKISFELVTGEDDPWRSSDIGMSDAIMDGTVESVVSAGVVVRLSNGIEGFLPRKEIACDKNADITKLFKAGDAIKVVSKEMKKEERRMILSQREIERREERENIKQYMKEPAEDEGSAIGSMYKNLFDDLKKKMGQ